jgi:hypothetical protein
MYYNPNVVEVLNITSSDVFPGTLITLVDIDNTNGTVEINLTNTGGIATTIPKPIVNVTFKAIGQPYNTTPINLTAVVHENGFIVNANVVNGSITVIPRTGDVNNDGNVDINDAVLIALMIVGESLENPSADLNGNGRIDIGDLTKLVYYLLGKIQEI